MAPKDEQHHTPCSLAVKTETRVDALESSVEKQWKSITALSDKIAAGIKDLQEKYINRLPLWATFLITALCSIVTGFIVAHFTRK